MGEDLDKDDDEDVKYDDGGEEDVREDITKERGREEEHGTGDEWG